MEKPSGTARVSPHPFHVGLTCFVMGLSIGVVCAPAPAHAQANASWFERSVVEELKEISAALKSLDRKAK